MEVEAAIPTVPAVTGKPAVAGKKGGVNWELIALAAAGSIAVVTGGMLVVQWKHAALGRRISNDVVDFLKLHGAVVAGKNISGGPVTVPMTIDQAVVGTIDTIIKDINVRAMSKAQAPGGADPKRAQAVTAAAEGAAPPAGGRPEFPEPAISGKTGQPVKEEEDLKPGQAPAEYAFAKNATGEDYSYVPHTPPGMRPAGGEIPE
jgi:hypothetical protein